MENCPPIAGRRTKKIMEPGSESDPSVKGPLKLVLFRDPM